MHILPFEYSVAFSEGLRETSVLNPYRFHEPDKETKDLLESAIESENIFALDGLLSNSKFEFDQFLALTMAIEGGHAKSVERLIQDPRVDPTAKDNEAVQCAACYGRTEIVKMLLQDSRVDPSAGDNDAIRWAAINGHAKIVKMLLGNPSVDPSSENNYAIRAAAKYGQTQVVQVLLEDPRVDPSAEDNAAIGSASEDG